VATWFSLAVGSLPALAQNWQPVSRAIEPGRSWRIVTGPQIVEQARQSGQFSWQVETAQQQQSSEDEDSAPRTSYTKPWIFGVGGGLRVGAGEPTYPMLYGRLGRKLSDDVALSLRPRYIFGNSDSLGIPNDQGAFQMPLTLDLRPDYWISPYVGVGLATNTDSSGATDAMVSLGADVRLGESFSLDLGMNYVFQSQSVDSDRGDLELTSVLYLRF
jgi:hypothetical protein